MKILIVDDSEMVRNYYYYILKTAGFDVISAIDGADGLEKLFNFPNTDLVVSDINMPAMDGYTMIERIREEDQFEELPIIIVSTEGEASDKQKGFNAGADVYIVKPIDPNILVENIKLLTDS
ncbi:MAG: response regulator transcription factor [bacterium]|nr:response regulator transcription factor [bacterium]